MKFVALESAKGLKVGTICYTLNEAGEYGSAKLISRTENEEGITHTFEVPQYFNKEKPSINAVTVTDITHVAIPKDKAKDE